MPGKDAYMDIANLPPIGPAVERLLDESENRYAIGQRARIKLSLRYAMHFKVVKGHVLDIAGHRAGEVYEAWRQTFHDVDIQATTTDLHDPLPYPDDSFDGAIAGEIFEHIGDRDFRTTVANFRGVISLLRETLRVLRPGGRCLLTTPNAASYKNISLAMCGTHPFMYTSHYREYTKVEIQRMLDFLGAKTIVFDTHDVFRQCDELVAAIAKFVEQYKLPTTDRGNDFFLVFEKPEGWAMPEIPANTSRLIYPNDRRGKFAKPWSFTSDARYEGEV